MSKLYGKVTSDTRQNVVTSGGHEFINATLYYGSDSLCIKAVDVTVKAMREGGFVLWVDIPGQGERAVYALVEGEAVRHE